MDAVDNTQNQALKKGDRVFFWEHKGGVVHYGRILEPMPIAGFYRVCGLDNQLEVSITQNVSVDPPIWSNLIVKQAESAIVLNKCKADINYNAGPMTLEKCLDERGMFVEPGMPLKDWGFSVIEIIFENFHGQLSLMYGHYLKSYDNEMDAILFAPLDRINTGTFFLGFVNNGNV